MPFSLAFRGVSSVEGKPLKQVFMLLRGFSGNAGNKNASLFGHEEVIKITFPDDQKKGRGVWPPLVLREYYQNSRPKSFHL